MSDDGGIDDVVIVGAGPAGTSAALALANAGLRVRLLDAGAAGARIAMPPEGEWLAMRHRDPEQWRWQLGDRFEALGAAAGSSPKFRVPGLQPIFAGYADANRLRAHDGFQLLGALAAGGLSNAWGCGVAAFDAAELSPLGPVECTAMADSYARVATRMGLSGAAEDALAATIGVDPWAQPALPMDGLHAHLYARRDRGDATFRLGRARVAVLSGEGDSQRRPCDLSGLCLWGCPRRATWSAALDLPAVMAGGVRVCQGVLVESLRRDGADWLVQGRAGGEARSFRARRVLLAAGTLASTRLALNALPVPPDAVRLQSNPMAAFLAFVPARLGAAHARSFGLAQLSFIARAGGQDAIGNLFSTAGLPVNEFLDYLPLSRRAGIPLLRALLPACTVGNVFLPGALSSHEARLDRLGELHVHGGADDALPAILGETRARLAAGLRAHGAWILPGSFVPGQPGADLHYACTLPIRAAPRPHECHATGEIAGLDGVYAIDGASLPQLPAKAHTLTLMANADRIAVGVRTALLA